MVILTQLIGFVFSHMFLVFWSRTNAESFAPALKVYQFFNSFSKPFLSVILVLFFVTISRAEVASISVNCNIVRNDKSFGNVITPLGTYQLQGVGNEMVMLNKIEVNIYYLDAQQKWVLYTQPARQASTMGNDWSSASYTNLPGNRTYKIEAKMFYTVIINGQPTNKDTTSSQEIPFN